MMLSGPPKFHSPVKAGVLGIMFSGPLTSLTGHKWGAGDHVSQPPKFHSQGSSGALGIMFSGPQSLLTGRKWGTGDYV